MASSIAQVLNALPWFAWIAIVAIVGSAVGDVVKKTIHHRERMAMIRMGIHPDAPTAKPYETEPAELA